MMPTHPNHIPIDTTQPARFNPQQKQKLQKATKEFEAIFLQMMLKSMRDANGNEEAASGFGDNFGGDMMKGMFDQQLAKHIANGSNLGVAEALYKKITGESIKSASARVHTAPKPVPHVTVPAVKQPSAAAKESAEVLPAAAEKTVHLPPPVQPAAAPKTFFTPDTTAVKDSTAVHSSALDRVKSYEKIISKAADTTGVNPNLIKAVMLQESGGKTNARSTKNAKGLMQLIDTTAASVGVKNVWDPSQNIHGGAKYLKQQLDRFNGDVKLALASYNAGPANVEKYNGVPPFPETRMYVKRVMQLFTSLEQSEEAKQ